MRRREDKNQKRKGLVKSSRVKLMFERKSQKEEGREGKKKTEDNKEEEDEE